MKALRYFRPLILFSCVANLLMLVAPLHMMQVYDRVLSSGSMETLLYLTLISFVLLGLYGAAEMLRSRLAHRISARFSSVNADHLMRNLTASGHCKGRSLDLLKQFNQLQAFLASRSFIGLFDLPFAPLFLLILFALHWHLGMITLIGAGLLTAIALTNKSASAKDQEQSSSLKGQSMQFALAIFERAEDIRAMGLSPALSERWGRMHGQQLNLQDQLVAHNAFYFGISRAFRMCLQIGILAWGAYLVLNGDMSGGLIFAASILAGKVLQPMEQVIGNWDSISRARDDYHVLKAYAAEQKPDAEKMAQPTPHGLLQAKSISYSVQYDQGSHQLLDDVSLTVGPGEIVTVVGTTGAGKSTFARLLTGAMEPSDGEISLDGCSQVNWPADQWGQYVGYVAQEIMLFPGTLAENIARLDLEPDEERILAAAQKAGVHQLINSFPDGYQTRLGPGGIRLSGGQQQRIALARALYTEPRVLVLDEPNAHLDKAGEDSLVAVLKRFARGWNCHCADQSESCSCRYRGSRHDNGWRQMRDDVSSQAK